MKQIPSYCNAVKQCCSVRGSFETLVCSWVGMGGVVSGSCTEEKMCLCVLWGKCSKWEIQKGWRTLEYPGHHLYRFPAFSHFCKNHLPPCRLTGPASVYGQSTVTVCLPVTEYRPSSEGVQPVWKTTHWLKERLHSPLTGGKKSVCVRLCPCVVTVSQTYCTMYANMPH